MNTKAGTKAAPERPWRRSWHTYVARARARSRVGSRLGALGVLGAVVALLVGVLPASALKLNSSDSINAIAISSHVLGAATLPQTSTRTARTTFPSGPVNSSEPSGESPPGANAMPGYRRSYVNDFTGTSLPSGWRAFSGTPSGDQGSLWAPTHVVVGNGLLQLKAWQDPAFANQWVTGGLSQYGVANIYGAYFVRSKLTAAGATQVEMLWPSGTEWPPEVDFNETRGGDTSTTATVHFIGNSTYESKYLNMDMTQWHTWGVVWTPTSITYTVDGEAWATITTTSEIPNLPMTLDITQQTWCKWGWGCPSAPESTLVDWVAEYTPSATTTVTPPSTTSTTTSSSPPSPTTTSTSTPTATSKTSAIMTVSPFATNSASLSATMKETIVDFARKIRATGETRVSLVGYSDDVGTRAWALTVSRARALAVESYLKKRLALMKVNDVTITATGKGSADPVASNVAPSGRARNRRVVSLIVKSIIP